MKAVEEVVEIGDYRLARTCFLPDGPPVATAVLLHGQGDFIARYGEVAEVFQARGIALVGTDMPGHGDSPGRRGHIPGFDYVDRVVESNLARCRELSPGKPHGILGHSCGALMALWTLLRDPSPWTFAWLSSPLLLPEATRPALVASLLLMLSRIMPGLSIDSGVGPKECVNPVEDNEGHAHLERSGDEHLFHTRVTLGWAQEICEAARWVRENFQSRLPPIPLLITLGEEDPVCAPSVVHGLLEGFRPPQLALHSFPGLRHEPFADPRRAQLLDVMAAFLEAEVLRTLPRPDTARGI